MESFIHCKTTCTNWFCGKEKSTDESPLVLINKKMVGIERFELSTF